jgi:hypothetical protein
VWGFFNVSQMTDWMLLGGPLIGFHFVGMDQNFSLIVGDICKPKYFGARKLVVRIDEKR